MDIRNYVINNFKGCSSKDILDTLNSSIVEKEEITLPGMGVLMEILWTNSNDELKRQIIDILKNNL